MKRALSVLLLFLASSAVAQEYSINYTLSVKSPGNPSNQYIINNSGSLASEAPVSIEQAIKQEPEGEVLTISLLAKENTYIHLGGSVELKGFEYASTQFYLPGFWYRKNYRSPDNAPNARVSKSWLVREDRLSTPMTAAFNETLGQGISMLRLDTINNVALTPLNEGEVILTGPTDLGAVGFKDTNSGVALTFSIPYAEAPFSYYRKLTLGNPVTAFVKLDKGEKVTYKYLIKKNDYLDYSDFVAQSWEMSYDIMKPKTLDSEFTTDQIEATLSQFWKQSFVTNSDGLKGYSGVHITTEKCEVLPLLEVGFVGRVLLNAFNSLEYAYETKDQQLIDMSHAIWNSYQEHGFTKGGLFRERIEENNNWETDVFSIRRQSEGIYAALFYLDYERKSGRIHEEWEQRVKEMLNLFMKIQQKDGSFPRKFDDDLVVRDSSGGSSSCVVPALVMAYKYFGDSKYLEMAREVADYQETELIGKADYFSSTLDANCEDKEASLYVATSLYYLAQVVTGEEKSKYIELAKKASYFALSWYYTWDVPFAQGQMLGDVGFKTRGWGNVSVENNHVDVYIFEFDEILDWLSVETSEPRFKEFANVIRSSMRSQLLPYEGHMVNIAKVGYHPEVVQHTQWDYGKFGKGFYNDIFAPGWVVASLWELLTEGRTESYFK